MRFGTRQTLALALLGAAGGAHSADFTLGSPGIEPGRTLNANKLATATFTVKFGP